DGVDAEICFPQLGLYLFTLGDPEIELASVQIYNDWNNTFFGKNLDRFVRCGVLPVRDLNNTIPEMKRIAAMGFTAAMMPVVTPKDVPGYNSDLWDPIFEASGELGVVLVFHTGTGMEDVIQERGPGGAVINYTRQMNDGINTVLSLVGGGVLDRNPKAKIAIIEAGASWLPAVAERMDEVYHAHQFYVRPKLSILPSEIIGRQVKASFQYDRSCVISRKVVGTQCFMFASDYPHMEGTFPRTRDVTQRLFEGVDITEAEKAQILSGNAAELFRFKLPAPLAQIAA
ncbi:MAG: amidohydrolase, partial [Brevundimonas sp.]|nr:amidohydrolase [Brevundimonas sp.]